MEHGATLFSLLFFSLMFIYIFLGAYIIRLNPKENLNRLYLAICIAMSVWSLGFAMANDAQTLAKALFWRRISAVGWSTLFSVMLHFLILLTREKSRLNKKWIFKALYIPSLINLYVFAFSNNMAQTQYNLKRFDLGWINIAVNNGWDWFFYLYYGLYIGASLIIAWKWKQQLEDKGMPKQRKLMSIPLFIAFILGSAVDVVLSSILEEPLPQMAPLFILLPTFTIYYLARYYGVMQQANFYKKEIIVTDQEQEKVFRNLSFAFYIAGILAFIAEYIPFMKEENAFKLALLKGLTLIIVGFIIRLIQNIKDSNVKANLTIIILVASVPLVLLQFLKYGGATVWVYPVVIMMSSLAFSKRTLLVSTTISVIITQRIIWIFRPEVTVTIDKYDYILRIGMLIVAFFIGLYINKLYVTKVRENSKQIAFQKINSDISREFIDINQENLDEKINKLMSMVGVFFQIDRTYLFLINSKESTMKYSYEWCGEGVDSEICKFDEMRLDVLPWWINELETNEIINIEDVNKMPSEANLEKEVLIHKKVKSLISVPIYGDSSIMGFLGIESVFSNRRWSEENIKQLNMISNLIAQGLVKIEAEKKIEFMAYYDRLTKLPNRFLFKDRTNQAIKIANKNSEEICIIFINLDNFKSVNDTIGHKGGDYLLKEVAQKLRETLKKTDTVSRFGGDEFMIMINDVKSLDYIFEITDKVIGLFLEPFKIQNQDFIVTGSAGIAMYPADGDDAETLIKNADTAMHKAKGKGKNQYVICTDDIKQEIKMNMILLNDLHHALERNELVVYYQPQLDIATGTINGLEALLRWVHPERGIISPGIFIPLAEQNGLINSIGE